MTVKELIAILLEEDMKAEIKLYTGDIDGVEYNDLYKTLFITSK